MPDPGPRAAWSGPSGSPTPSARRAGHSSVGLNVHVYPSPFEFESRVLKWWHAAILIYEPHELATETATSTGSAGSLQNASSES
jgi:hypothetical protein